ncbi:MAG: alpha-glycosidase [Armatimonadetes bacterium]|nr:alpha-glycosidase [Armatimonadota bacterium]
MLSLALLAVVQTQPVNKTFEYVASQKLERVNVAGSFNGWNKDKDALKLRADGKTWAVTLPIPPGRHEYKFVLNGSDWILDPANKNSADDGGGHVNSVFVILPKGFESAAKVGDGKVTLEALSHIPKVPSLNFDQGQLSLTFVARTGDVQKVIFETAAGEMATMTKESGDELYTTYRTELSWNQIRPLPYRFTVVDGPRRVTFGASGANSKDFFKITPKTFTPMKVPAWVEKTVFYQIFPDRFENGSKANDPEKTEDWTTGIPTYSNWFGGDAVGIQSKIPYLKDLGVNGIYINPIMEANSNHRYDPSDFYKIDPPFGTNEEFIELTKALDSAGIRTVLDQIFDHVGIKFGPFLDVLSKQEQSKFLKWFFIKSFPVSVKQNPPYEGWFGTEYMPKVDMMNPEVRKYMLDSVTYWMKNAKLSGWRMDVANEVPNDFWRAFRKHVKAQDPNAWIVGEVWYNAAPWLSGDQWDASMNYPFRDKALGFIAQGTTTANQFVNGLMQVYNFTAPQVSRNQLNLLSSHDTERFIHVAGGNRDLAKLGAVLQFTWPGAPSVYYGEELGMPGGRDPDNRRPMDWTKANAQNDMLSFYKKLIKLRTTNQTLQSGSPVVLSANDSQRTVAYARVYGNSSVITIMNRSEQPQKVTVPLARLNKPALIQAKTNGYLDALTGTRMKLNASNGLTVEVPALSAIIAVNPTGGISKPAKLSQNLLEKQ